MHNLWFWYDHICMGQLDNGYPVGYMHNNAVPHCIQHGNSFLVHNVSLYELCLLR